MMVCHGCINYKVDVYVLRAFELHSYVTVHQKLTFYYYYAIVTDSGLGK